jgi:predicted phosphodiesterase
MNTRKQSTSRKTRIVCVSDTHNTSPADGAFKLPVGDVLIHAGDLTNQGTYAEIRKALDWIAAADFEVKIVVAGNLCKPSKYRTEC